MSVLREINPVVNSFQTSEHSIIGRRAFEICAEMKEGSVKPYKELLDVSSGDPHSLGLKPLTFVRQVLATCFYPTLLHDDVFPMDVRNRAQHFLRECDGGSIGSYTATCGIRKVQNAVSEFITRRDAIASDPDNIFITNGSQNGLRFLLKLLASSQQTLQTGVLTPAPGYRSFSKALFAEGAVSVPYYLCEDQGWSLQVEELRRALHAARGHCNPVVLYVVNPGNPSGHVQSKESIEEVIRFAAEERLFILADEVYQSCVYGKGSEFYSYKKVLSEMGSPYSSNVELASFHSASKGIMGECGLRGGYVEVVNLDTSVMQYAYKLFSTTSCASVPGQLALDLMVDPPKPGEPSYALYAQEGQSLMSKLKNNVQRILEVVRELPGLTCQTINGGMFAYLHLHLSQSAIFHAKEKKLMPDVLYCLWLLEETGLRVSPGCEFGQKAGTYHIRICIASQEDIMEDVLQRLKTFHLRFIKEFP